MEDKILDLFFNQKKKQVEIAQLLNISKGTVSKILNKDSRFVAEKERRKAENKIKHNKVIQKQVECNRKKAQFKNNTDDLILKRMHAQASQELSKRSHLTNENYRKWNYSAYKYNPSKKRFEFNNNLCRSYDVPKYINAKIF